MEHYHAIPTLVVGYFEIIRSHLSLPGYKLTWQTYANICIWIFWDVILRMSISIVDGSISSFLSSIMNRVVKHPGRICQVKSS